ncbi:hypothetical protein OAI46_02530 [Alphaproteobacteria bacterium]|nr:hypothetical protein [Alphaproteobacteria bacterium]MDC0147731.1 hypothetical protein [Alphaproteobacteria bacterium]
MLKNVIIASLAFVLTGCGSFTDGYQENQRKVINYLLSDLPIPGDADIMKEPTVILGTGAGISGRIVLESNYAPAENLIFYGNETPSTGWLLVSSKVGEEISLVYTKDGRYATIHITPQTGPFTEFSLSGSDIIISVVHPNAVSVQNPYQGLDYKSLPNDPEGASVTPVTR